MKFIPLVLSILTLFLILVPKILFAGEWVISSYPLFKIMQEIFKEERLHLIQPPKGEFHFADPTPKDWQRVREAELLIIVGTEPWAKKVSKILPSGKIFSLTKTGEKYPDPHLWFDFDRLERALRELTELQVVKAKPLFSTYKKRMEDFLLKLREVKKVYQSLKNCPQREFYSLGHGAFYYLSKEASIKEIPLIKGHHHGEISSKKLREVLQSIKEKRIKAILLTEREFIRYKRTFENEGVEVLEAWTGDFDIPGDYLSLLEDNLKVFKKILNCQ